MAAACVQPTGSLLPASAHRNYVPLCRDEKTVPWASPPSFPIGFRFPCDAARHRRPAGYLAARPWERVSKSVLTACWPGCRRGGFSDQKNRAIAGLFADRHFAPFDPAGQTIVGYYEGFSIAATGRCSAVPAIRPSATRRSGARIRTAIAARCASLNPATRLGSAASSCLRRPRCTGRARSTARQHAEAPRRASMVRSAERLPGVVRRKTDMANPFFARAARPLSGRNSVQAAESSAAERDDIAGRRSILVSASRNRHRTHRNLGEETRAA